MTGSFCAYNSSHAGALILDPAPWGTCCWWRARMTFIPLLISSIGLYKIEVFLRAASSSKLRWLLPDVLGQLLMGTTWCMGLVTTSTACVGMRSFFPWVIVLLFAWNAKDLSLRMFLHNVDCTLIIIWWWRWVVDGHFYMLILWWLQLQWLILRLLIVF